jgi:hypothetical protein
MSVLGRTTIILSAHSHMNGTCAPLPGFRLLTPPVRGADYPMQFLGWLEHSKWKCLVSRLKPRLSRY